MADGLVALGVIAKPHGVSGQVRVHLFNPESRLLEAYSEVLLRAPDGEVSVAEVSSFGRGKDYIRFEVNGSDSREAAEALRGYEVCLPRDALPALQDGEHYLVDLEGLEVQGADGVRLGQVERVVSLPTIDCLRVKLERDFVEIPILDRYFLGADYEAGTIRVDNVDELPVERPPSRKRPKRGGGA